MTGYYANQANHAMLPQTLATFASKDSNHAKLTPIPNPPIYWQHGTECHNRVWLSKQSGWQYQTNRAKS
jgi:hypothetical protein